MRVKARDFRIEPEVPVVLRGAAAYSWRLLISLAAVVVLAYLINYLAVVTVPVAIALLLSALFAPVVRRLVSWRVPRGLATAIAVIVGLAVVGGVLYLFISTITAGLPDLTNQVSASIEQISAWLRDGPLHLSQDQLQGFLDQIVQWLQANKSVITSGALSTAASVGEALTGILLCLFTLIFFLHDGDGIWRFLVRILVPGANRDRVQRAGRHGFTSLEHYVRATVLVALVDAVGIGIGLAIVGVPLAVPLAALVFLGAFIPIIGAVLTGAIAVLVALVTKGLVAALIVLAIVVLVMQLESHVLQPLLLGRAVKIHPLAVVLGVAAGMVIAGIAGALLAVPLLAVANASIRSLWSERAASAEPDGEAEKNKDDGEPEPVS